MAEHKYAVYMHIFPNKKKYIGITGQKPKERWRVNGATIAAKETGEHRNTITRHCRGEVLKPRWEYTK